MTFKIYFKFKMSLNPSLSTIFQFQRLFSFFGGSEGWGGRKGPQKGFQMLISPHDKGAEPPREKRGQAYQGTQVGGTEDT